MVTLQEISQMKKRYPEGTELAVTMNWPHMQNFDKRANNYGKDVVETRECKIIGVTASCAIIEFSAKNNTNQVLRSTFDWVDIITGDVILELY